MTNDKLNISHYQAMPKLDLDDEKRSAPRRLLAEAEEVLATEWRYAGAGNSEKTSDADPRC
jgi:hypothetical protein